MAHQKDTPPLPRTINKKSYPTPEEIRHKSAVYAMLHATNIRPETTVRHDLEEGRIFKSLRGHAIWRVHDPEYLKTATMSRAVWKDHIKIKRLEREAAEFNKHLEVVSKIVDRKLEEEDALKQGRV